MRHLKLAVPLGLAAGLGVLASVQPPSEVVIAEFGTSLDGRLRSQRHNAVLSMERLQGATVGPGEVFSFNRLVGTFSRDAGYRKAPVSYNGQLVSSWGGGVCQTSTTLYNAALYAGMEIVERNRHRFAPSYVPPGRDAAVAYESIDLKFRNPHPFPVRIEGRIQGERLIVSMVGARPLEERPQIVQDVRQVVRPQTMEMRGPGHLAGGSRSRLRNSGKAGYEVAVYRLHGGKRELLSSDSYPPMHRIVEYE